MAGFAILLFFNLIGLLLQRLGVPLPANVIGLILFTLCLFLGIVKLKWVETAANFLLRHMLLFFAPVVVGVIAFESMIRREWLPITVGLVCSWLVVVLVTGWTATALSRGER
jgi:holin-like protein